tara:strand:- start:2332 stop:2940 length:609 start_codon:yes stop_codon:yes gene_type:complete
VDHNFVDSLLDNYIYQKEKLLERGGAQGALNQERLRSMVKPRVEKMALAIEDLNVSPDIVMSAVFAWANYNRHPDGPMPNMLHSVKYVTKALSHYLQIPYEVVSEKRCMTFFLERMDFDYRRIRGELAKAGVTDLVACPSYPVEYRYVMAASRLDMESAFFMAYELLDRMANDKRTTMWLNHRGVTYEKVAKHFNKMKSKYE